MNSEMSYSKTTELIMILTIGLLYRCKRHHALPDKTALIKNVTPTICIGIIAIVMDSESYSNKLMDTPSSMIIRLFYIDSNSINSRYKNAVA